MPPETPLVVVLGNYARRAVGLQTALCNDIPNEQYLEVPDSDLKTLDDIFDSDYAGLIERRCGPTGVYNCHGLTFGSRRTWLYEHRAIPMILKDDSYTSVALDYLKAGDVIIYYQDGDPVHSGVVVQTLSPAPPIVVSKWAHAGEFLHSAQHSPYGNEWKFFRVDNDQLGK